MQRNTSLQPRPPRRWRAFGLATPLLLAAQLAIAGPLWAQSRWTFRAHGALWTGISDQVTLTRGAGQSVHSISDGSSFGISLEYLATRQLGIELGFLAGGIDTEFRTETGAGPLTDSDMFDIYATTVGFNYHWKPARPTDLYLGLFVQQTNFSDVTFLSEAGLSRTLSFDDDYGVGLKLGFDRPFRRESSWIFTADVRYVATILEAESGGEDLDIHPLIVSVGVGYRF